MLYSPYCPTVPFLSLARYHTMKKILQHNWINILVVLGFGILFGFLGIAIVVTMYDANYAINAVQYPSVAYSQSNIARVDSQGILTIEEPHRGLAYTMRLTSNKPDGVFISPKGDVIFVRTKNKNGSSLTVFDIHSRVKFELPVSASSLSVRSNTVFIFEDQDKIYQYDTRNPNQITYLVRGKNPSYFPNSDDFMFQTLENTIALYLARTDEIKILLTDGNLSQPLVSPDGTMMSFVETYECRREINGRICSQNLRIYTFETQKLRLVLSSKKLENIAWKPSSNAIVLMSAHQSYFTLALDTYMLSFDDKNITIAKYRP